MSASPRTRRLVPLGAALVVLAAAAVSASGRTAANSDDCVDSGVTKDERTALHAGVGYAIREVGGPALGTPFQYSAP